MDRLPCELLHHIFWYIDQPLDLLRMSYVCSRWRSFIMDGKYFLNQWFSRSLEHSRQPFSVSFHDDINDSEQQSMLNIDQSLFPINLRSSECQILRWTHMSYLSTYVVFYTHYYPLSLGDSSHSFSFWFFSPPQCEFDIVIRNVNGCDIFILLGDELKYNFDNGKRVSVANRWFHIALSKTVSQDNYRIWIDGQHFSDLNICYRPRDEMKPGVCSIAIGLMHKFDDNLSGAPDQGRIADLNAFNRCLTPVEIRAIHRQQTSITQVKVGTYINSNKIHNMKVDCH